MRTQKEGDVPLPLVQRFPRPGTALRLAYRELDIAENGTADQKRALGTIADLPRPWSAGTCRKPQERADLWIWLDAVVAWVNHELVFDPADVIPSCWPQHPHLVHELAVLADLRRRADLAVDSDALEEWHRNALPSFLERMRRRVADHCTGDHPAVWPAAGRFGRYLSEKSAAERQSAFTDDVRAVRDASVSGQTSPMRPDLRSVDKATGELRD